MLVFGEYLLGNEVIKGFGPSWNFYVVRKVGVLHIVRTFAVLFDESFSSRTESFNGVAFTFLHLRVVVWHLHTWYCLASVNSVRLNRMPVQISNYFYRVGSSLNLHFVGLHYLLYLASNFTESHIDSSFPEACIGCILNCFEKLIIGRIEGDCECSIYDPSVDLRSEVDFADIIIADDGIVPIVWSVVSSNMIERATCWETNT